MVQATHEPSFPKDLASAVHAELLERRVSEPNLEALIELFESMFFTSLQTKESRPVVFHVVYIDPGAPDPKAWLESRQSGG
jgi:hypothetical protein